MSAAFRDNHHNLGLNCPGDVTKGLPLGMPALAEQVGPLDDWVPSVDPSIRGFASKGVAPLRLLPPGTGGRPPLKDLGCKPMATRAIHPLIC